ncbi:MAG: FadR/GntR family transcriptional regulator, partial [Bdellovibrionota bacterium]
MGRERLRIAAANWYSPLAPFHQSFVDCTIARLTGQSQVLRVRSGSFTAQFALVAEGRMVRSPRVSEMVAERLRLQILRGEVGDTGRLPPQEELLQKFDVGLPSIREALRILEVEGLVT